MPFTPLEDSGDPSPTVLTVGFFDGVHRGHRAIIDRVVQTAAQRNMKSAVLTFDPHPKSVLSGGHIDLLTSLEEKSALLKDAGIDEVYVATFDKDLSELSPRDFVTDILVGALGMVHVVIGYDHAFGKGASGNPKTVTELGEELGFTTEVVGPFKMDDRPISSSLIRTALIERGDVSDAARQLGRHYSLTGRVVKGDGRGKQVGFPTANLELEEAAKIVPANGVYAVTVERLETGLTHPGIMNIGVRPTLTSGHRRVLEVHLLRFYDDLYDEPLTVKFLDHIRDEKKFKGVEALRAQISKDIADCIRIHNVVSSLD